MAELLFGNHTQTVDDRYRVAVPARLMPSFRALAGVGEEDPVDVVLTVTPNKCVGVYPRKVFESLMERLEAHSARNFRVGKLKKSYLRNRDDQTLDKQNRFRIPVSLARKYSLFGEVMVMGSDDILEVANLEAWEKQHEAEVEEMEELHGLLENLEAAPEGPGRS